MIIFQVFSDLFGSRWIRKFLQHAMSRQVFQKKSQFRPGDQWYSFLLSVHPLFQLQLGINSFDDFYWRSQKCFSSSFLSFQECFYSERVKTSQVSYAFLRYVCYMPWLLHSMPYDFCRFKINLIFSMFLFTFFKISIYRYKSPFSSRNLHFIYAFFDENMFQVPYSFVLYYKVLSPQRWR